MSCVRAQHRTFLTSLRAAMKMAGLKHACGAVCSEPAIESRRGGVSGGREDAKQHFPTFRLAGSRRAPGAWHRVHASDHKAAG